MDNVTASYLAGIIDGEGTITLTKLHNNELRRPLLTIASTDHELLSFIRSILGGVIISKKNYKPQKHKDSFTLTIKNKDVVLHILHSILSYLRVTQKYNIAKFILDNYEKVTIRNGRYNQESLNRKLKFEEKFFIL